MAFVNVHRNGTETTVCVTWADCREFAARWPCFGDPRPLTFTFDSRGDLVDIVGTTGGLDPAGVSALCDDAKRFATDRLSM